MKNFARIGALAGLIGLSAGLFQNCSRAELERPSVALSLEAEGQTDWCIEGALQGYTVEAFYARNINVLPWLGDLVPDSDGDGLPDSVESSMGFDPQNPRSRSRALDRICYDQGNNTGSCPNIPTACDPAPNALGISDCDIQTLKLDQKFGHPTQGLDTDKDRVPDFFEILVGMNPLVADAAQDPDHDNLLNQDEISRGSNPYFYDPGLPESLLLAVHSKKLNASVNPSCTGENWQFSIEHLPYVPTLALTSSITSGAAIEHVAGDNVVVVYVKLRPNPGVSGNAKIYSQTFVVNPATKSLPLDANALQLVGEVLP